VLSFWREMLAVRKQQNHLKLSTYHLTLFTFSQGGIKKRTSREIREGPNQKPLTIKPYPMKIHEQYR
jgi:phage terminase large subunit